MNTWYSSKIFMNFRKFSCLIFLKKTCLPLDQNVSQGKNVLIPPIFIPLLSIRRWPSHGNFFLFTILFHFSTIVFSYSSLFFIIYGHGYCTGKHFENIRKHRLGKDSPLFWWLVYVTLVGALVSSWYWWWGLFFS